MASQEEPKKIHRLEDHVVNRIAAGEIIQRPANALKELIENSLDAKSTNIQIIVKQGGLKLLQIQDNGTGINKADLEILCERFTTSKLNTFEDLSSINTYGFRGEALASISHVAQLAVQTKTAMEKCAYRVMYEDGKLKGPPKLCAGNQGTQISVENLFYNAPQRKRVLRAPNDEYHKIYDVVSKYAIHNSGVAFSLKKHGESNALRTQNGASKIDNIQSIYGATIAKELLEVAVKDEALQFEMSGLISNANHGMKKGVTLLFINHRLVDSTALKQILDTIYALYLSKNTHPFIYMSILICPSNIDVNVHPTKHEVQFLHEEAIFDKIKHTIEEKLLDCGSSRTFYVQSRLPGALEPVLNESKDAGDKTVYDKYLIRTDAKEQKIQQFFGNSQQVKALVSDEASSSDPAEESFRIQLDRKDDPSRKQTKLSSILRMRQSIEKGCNRLLRNVLKDLTYVGSINQKQAVIQYDTKMYICDTERLIEELFYQILLYDFENFSAFTFEEGLSVMELTLIALDLEESGWTEEDGPKEELSQRVVDVLIEKAPIMREYFCINITETGMLRSLPILIENYKPNFAFLPMYMLRLATEVNWDDEAECFQTLCRETAYFYCRSGETTSESEWKWVTEHALYPAIKKFLLPPESFMNDKTLLQVANLPDLYKVFERC